jgi:hypothetical protein
MRHESCHAAVTILLFVAAGCLVHPYRCMRIYVNYFYGLDDMILPDG